MHSSSSISSPRLTPSLVSVASAGQALLAAGILFAATGNQGFAQETPPEAPAVETETADDTFAPKEHALDRYQKLRGKSPFEFELAKAPVAEAADPFADFVLAGFAGSAANPTVYLLNTKSQERITIVGEASARPNKSGFKLISIDRGRTLSSTSATLEKDGVQQKLNFDKKALYSMTGGAAGGGGAMAGGNRPPGAPGQPGGAPGQGPRPAIPGQARPQQMYQAPQAFIPGQGNRGAGSIVQQTNGTIQMQAGGGQAIGSGTGGVMPAAGGQVFIPNQGGANQPPVIQAPNVAQNQPVSGDNTVRSVQQQQQINQLLEGKGPVAAPPPRRRVVLPNSP